MKKLEIADVQRAVADFYKVSVADLCGLWRTVPLVRYRQLAYWLCRQHTSASLPAIGEKFGGRDHATIIHGLKAVSAQIPLDEQLRRDIDAIERLAGLGSTSRKAALVAARLAEIDRTKTRIEANREAVYGLQSLWS